jgi:glycerol-3-phosphate acyltransferase PlsX|tara:strand:+ start:1204 stop:2208 length:1005 start_codon:yes stop_codon:yes gene_type:complete
MLGSETTTQEILKGLQQSLLRNIDYKFLLYGNKKTIIQNLKSYKKLHSAVEVFDCSDFISMNDKPSEIIKNKSSSSMYQAIKSVNDNIADAVLSFGNTGALMTLSLLNIKTLSEIKRPSIASIWPNLKGESIVLDLGANTKLNSRYLIDNAILGSSLASILFKIEKPSIGILNVGSEDIKGNDEIRNAAKRLKFLSEIDLLNYQGYIEGNDISLGKTNVVVTDGFTGNIALKTAEGTAKLFQSHLKDAFNSSVFSQMGYFLSSIQMKSVKERLDPRVHNCGIFMGLNSLVVKCHGQSEYRGVSYAADIIHSLLANGVNEKIREYVRETQNKLDN